MKENGRKYFGKFVFMMLIVCACLMIPNHAQAATKTGNSAGNILSGSSYKSNVCKSGRYIYYNVYSKLYRYDTKKNKTKLVKNLSKYCGKIYTINVYKGYFYMTFDKFNGTSDFNQYIYRMKLNGKNVKKLGKGSNCTVVNGKIYYVKQKTMSSYQSDMSTGIGRMSTSGKSKKTLYTVDGTSNYIYNMAVSGGRIYFNGSNGIASISTSGGSYQMVRSGTGADLLDVEGNYIYYTTSSYNRYTRKTTTYLYKRKVDGTDASVVISGYINSCAVEGNTVYYYDSQYYTGGENVPLMKRAINGGTATKVATIKGGTRPLICGGYIFSSRYIANARKNTQTLVMKTSGKRIKYLQKFFIS